MVRRAMREIDFGDEEAVLMEVAKAIDVAPEHLTIKEEDQFGVTVYEIFLGRRNGKEWRVVENEDEERELALEIVKQDLDQESELFDKSFLEQHININRLRDELEADVLNERI